MTTIAGSIRSHAFVPQADCVGIDIGGANIKYALPDGRASSVDFPLWLRPNELASQLKNDLTQLPAGTPVAATMTGELADCFLDRREGVLHIAAALDTACHELGLLAPVFYAVDGNFCAIADLPRQIDCVAASNWHALANWIGRTWATSGAVLVVDIGSTTTDMIPLLDGCVPNLCRTDTERLTCGWLVYLGCGRTPVCSIVGELGGADGKRIPVMREVFATIQDARVLLGFESENKHDTATADGKPRDIFHSANRIARMIGLDHRNVTDGVAKSLARQIHQTAIDIVSKALEAFPEFDTIVFSGHGADLLESSSRGLVDLRGLIGEQPSRCAPAVAVAELWSASNKTKTR